MYILCEGILYCFASEMVRPFQINDVSLALQLTYHGGQLIIFQSAVTKPLETIGWFFY